MLPPPEFSLTPGMKVKPGISTRSDFKLVPSATALLIIDVQDHLSSMASSAHEDDEDDSKNNSAYLFTTSLPIAIPNMVKLAKTMRSLREKSNMGRSGDTSSSSAVGAPVVGCEVIITFLQSHTPDCRDISLDYKLSGPKLCNIPNPANIATFSTLPQELHPSSIGRGDIILPKTSCSVFQSTNLRYILNNLNIRQLVICGQLTDQCVMSAVRDGADLGFLVTVVEDACAALSLEDHERGIMGMKGFARIMTCQQVLDELLSSQPHSDNVHDSKQEGQNIDLESKDCGEIVGDKLLEQVVQKPKAPSLSVCCPSSWRPNGASQIFGAVDALLNALLYSNVQFLRFASIDISNKMRVKAIPVSNLAQASMVEMSPAYEPTLSKLSGRVCIAKATMAGTTSYGDDIVPETGLDTKDVLVLEPDISTMKILPYSPKSAIVFGTLHDQRTGTLSPFCTRGLLVRVLETAQKNFGIGFVVGVEIEFCLIKLDGEGKVIPIDESLFAGSTSLNDQEVFISHLHCYLQQQGIHIEAIHSESAPGQIEVVLPCDLDVIKVADNIVLTRETIKVCAKRYGMRAVFSPKPYDDKAGSGMHLHLSLRYSHSTANIFCGASPDTISDIGQSFLEGILCHLKALVSLTVPTTKSFSRIGKGCWTGYAVGWKIEEKESPLRVCIDLRSRKITNVEMKIVDNTCNVYLALASILWAGMDGIQRNMVLRSVSEDGCNLDLLPRNLGDSLDCLLQDEVLGNLLGEDLLRSYIAVRRNEIEVAKNQKNLEAISSEIGR
jgi:glutamine synthetase